jgi:3-dehydroquinate dehydratase-2
MPPELSALRTGTRRHRIALIDGPNMSNLGRRNARVYGTIGSLEELHAVVGELAGALGVELRTFSSNYEGAILEFLHETAEETDGYIINPAGLTLYGEATRHALEETGRPAIEVHFANISSGGGGAGQARGLPAGRLAVALQPLGHGCDAGDAPVQLPRGARRADAGPGRPDVPRRAGRVASGAARGCA